MNPGDKVFHYILGVGHVVSEDEFGYVIVDFVNHGTNSVPSSSLYHKEEQFIIVNINKLGEWVMAEKPTIHSTEDSAKTEAKRLASINPTADYVVLKVIGKTKRTDITFESKV